MYIPFHPFVCSPANPPIFPLFPIPTSLPSSLADSYFPTPCSWYRSGSEQKLQSVLKPGGGRDFATTSVLTINPGKDDDGAEYRCVIWNRALTDSEKMESVVTLSVNCKNLLLYVFFAGYSSLFSLSALFTWLTSLSSCSSVSVSFLLPRNYFYYFFYLLIRFYLKFLISPS